MENYCIFVKIRGDFLRILAKIGSMSIVFFKPKYDSTEHFFVVTLPNVKWTGEETKTVNETVK